MTKEEKAVLDAAMKWHASKESVDWPGPKPKAQALYKACAKLYKARALVKALQDKLPGEKP